MKVLLGWRLQGGHHVGRPQQLPLCLVGGWGVLRCDPQKYPRPKRVMDSFVLDGLVTHNRIVLDHRLY